MKRFTQFVCILLVLTTVLVVPASALESNNQKASSYFGKYSVYLWESSSTQFQVWFDVTALQSMDVLGASEIKVQQSTDQVNWTTVQTYDMADYAQMTDENTIRYANCVTYTYTPGYYYSAIVELYAKNGSSYGKMDVATPIKYF